MNVYSPNPGMIGPALYDRFNALVRMTYVYRRVLFDEGLL